MDIKQFLRENNIKVTKGRLNIFDILTKSNSAITADYIYSQCKKNNINIDLSTIYRNLELFNIKGILDKFDLGDGKYSYIINFNKHTHILQCCICHKEIEIECPIQQIEHIIKNKTGFTIEEDETDIRLKGLCENCRNKKTKNNI